MPIDKPLKPRHLRLVPKEPAAVEPAVVETAPLEDQVFELLTLACSDSVVVDPEKLRTALNDLYVDLSLSDSVLITMLTTMEEQGVVSRNDRMYLFILFAAAQRSGHETLTFLRDEIIHQRLQVAGLQSLIDTMKLPDPLRRYLANGLGRLAFQFANQPKPWQIHESCYTGAEFCSFNCCFAQRSVIQMYGLVGYAHSS